MYFNANGEAVQTTYELNKTVPSNAKFTDTTYSNATTSTAGLMSADDKTRLNYLKTITRMTSLGFTKGSSVTVHEFFTKLREKGYRPSSNIYFSYDNSNTANVTDGTTTVSMNGASCFITNNETGTWRKDYALVSQGTKTYLLYVLYSGSTTPTSQKIVDLTKDTTYSAATTSAAGLMSAADKTAVNKIGSTDISGIGDGTITGAIKSLSANSLICTWGGGTDEQIKMMLSMHYAGLIDIADYWNVGDVRTVSIASFSSGTNEYTYASQKIQLVIIGIKHDNLTSSINGVTKAAITVQTKQVLRTSGTTIYPEYYNGKSKQITNTSNWNNSPIRTTTLNNNFYNALSTSLFRGLIKTVTKKNLSTHESTSTVNTSDKIFLPSYVEVYGLTNVDLNLYLGGQAVGSTPSSYEGTQYYYFTTSNNVTKYTNNNGTDSSSTEAWLLRSPGYYTSSVACYVCFNVYTSTIMDESSYCGYIAPCFCL